MDKSPMQRADAVRRVELLLSRLLRAGVVVSLLTVVTGLVMSFARHPDYSRSVEALERLTHPDTAMARSLGDVWRGIAEGRGQAVTALGLLLLIATPVVRVAASVVAYLVERDWTYAIITGIVLALLVVSFVIGKVE